MSKPGKEARTRTISWEDPRALAEAGRGLSGEELEPQPNTVQVNVNVVAPHLAPNGAGGNISEFIVL